MHVTWIRHSCDECGKLWSMPVYERPERYTCPTCRKAAHMAACGDEAHGGTGRAERVPRPSVAVEALLHRLYVAVGQYRMAISRGDPYPQATDEWLEVDAAHVDVEEAMRREAEYVFPDALALEAVRASELDPGT